MGEMIPQAVQACHDLETISTRRCEHGARLMDDLGRQIGGWLRSSRGRGNPA